MAKVEKFQVLDLLDKATTQWYHFTAIIIAGMGFFTDAYDLFCITTVTKLLGRLYYYDASTGNPGTLPAVVNSSVTGVALVGSLLGQLLFGWLGDRLGRRKVYGITLMLMFCSSIASAFSFGSTAKSVMISLCFARFWLGFGIGGDYPLSATIMSEYANTRTRGGFIAAVFAMQGFGILAAAAVAILVSASFMNAYPAKSFQHDPVGSTPPQADFVWRIILILGALPAALTFYWRMRMPETARFTALVAGDIRQAAKDMEEVLQLEIDTNEAPEIEKPDQFGLISGEFLRRHGLHLLATTSTWFLLDVAFYGSSLSQKDVLTTVGWLHPAKSMSAIEEVYVIARAQALIALCATIPGYWFTVFLIDRIGRFTIQLQGFFFMTLFTLLLGIPYMYWRGFNCDTSPAQICGGHHAAFVIIYSLTFFFSNFGPNTTTFILPAEIFPARLRSTCHGISAGAGKAGAILGALGFQLLAEDPGKKYDDAGYSPGIGLQKTLLLLAGCNGMGFLLTFLLPETKGKSLEELCGEDGYTSSTKSHKKPSIRATLPLDVDA